jgi:hypothetical protein
VNRGSAAAAVRTPDTTHIGRSVAEEQTILCLLLGRTDVDLSFTPRFLSRLVVFLAAS